MYTDLTRTEIHAYLDLERLSPELRTQADNVLSDSAAPSRLGPHAAGHDHHGVYVTANRFLPGWRHQPDITSWRDLPVTALSADDDLVLITDFDIGMAKLVDDICCDERIIDDPATD